MSRCGILGQIADDGASRDVAAPAATARGDLADCISGLKSTSASDTLLNFLVGNFHAKEVGAGNGNLDAHPPVGRHVQRRYCRAMLMIRLTLTPLGYQPQLEAGDGGTMGHALHARGNAEALQRLFQPGGICRVLGTGIRSGVPLLARSAGRWTDRHRAHAARDGARLAGGSGLGWPAGRL